MIADVLPALGLLSNRINEKHVMTVYDIQIVDAAAAEIKRLRDRVAVLDAELNKAKP